MKSAPTAVSDRSNDNRSPAPAATQRNSPVLVPGSIAVGLQRNAIGLNKPTQWLGIALGTETVINKAFQIWEVRSLSDTQGPSRRKPRSLLHLRFSRSSQVSNQHEEDGMACMPSGNAVSSNASPKDVVHVHHTITSAGNCNRPAASSSGLWLCPER